MSTNIRTGGTSVADNDYTIILDRNISLPAASSNTDRILVLCADSSTNRTITGSLQDSSGSFSSIIVSDTVGLRCLTVQSTGTSWWIIARN